MGVSADLLPPPPPQVLLFSPGSAAASGHLSEYQRGRNAPLGAGERPQRSAPAGSSPLWRCSEPKGVGGGSFPLRRPGQGSRGGGRSGSCRAVSAARSGAEGRCSGKGFRVEVVCSPSSPHPREQTAGKGQRSLSGRSALSGGMRNLGPAAAGEGSAGPPVFGQQALLLRGASPAPAPRCPQDSGDSPFAGGSSRSPVLSPRLHPPNFSRALGSPEAQLLLS